MFYYNYNKMNNQLRNIPKVKSADITILITPHYSHKHQIYKTLKDTDMILCVLDELTNISSVMLTTYIVIMPVNCLMTWNWLTTSLCSSHLTLTFKSKLKTSVPALTSLGQKLSATLPGNVAASVTATPSTNIISQVNNTHRIHSVPTMI